NSRSMSCTSRGGRLTAESEGRGEGDSATHARRELSQRPVVPSAKVHARTRSRGARSLQYPFGRIDRGFRSMSPACLSRPAGGTGGTYLSRLASSPQMYQRGATYTQYPLGRSVWPAYVVPSQWP